MKPIVLEPNVWSAPCALPAVEAINWSADAYVLRRLWDEQPREASEARARVSQLFPHVSNAHLTRAADLYQLVAGSAWGAACLNWLRTCRPSDVDAARTALLGRLQEAPPWAREAGSIVYTLLHLNGESTPPETRRDHQRTEQPQRFGYRGQR